MNIEEVRTYSLTLPGVAEDIRMTNTNAILIYLFAINIVAFVVYGIDKYKAKHAKWRISEATLLLLAVIGGSIGAWCGMRVWHHKTMHKKFKYGVPLVFILQLAIAVWIINRMAQTSM